MRVWAGRGWGANMIEALDGGAELDELRELREDLDLVIKGLAAFAGTAQALVARYNSRHARSVSLRPVRSADESVGA